MAAVVFVSPVLTLDSPFIVCGVDAWRAPLPPGGAVQRGAPCRVIEFELRVDVGGVRGLK